MRCCRSHEATPSSSRAPRKEPTSPYRRVRSPAWLKVKPKLQIEVVVTGGSAQRIASGDWGAAVNLELAYTHPRTAARHEIRQAVHVARDRPFDLRVAQGAEPSSSAGA